MLEKLNPGFVNWCGRLLGIPEAPNLCNLDHGSSGNAATLQRNIFDPGVLSAASHHKTKNIALKRA
jgi:hypothetical protein